MGVSATLLGRRMMRALSWHHLAIGAATETQLLYPEYLLSPT